MLIWIILIFVIVLLLFRFLAKKANTISDTSDYTHPYSSITSTSDLSQNDDARRSDDCSSYSDTSSDSSSCDSGSSD